MRAKKLLALLIICNYFNSYAYSNCIIGNCNEKYGIYEFEDGSWYEGFWFDGQPNGIGIKVKLNSKTQEGIWDYGKYKSFKDVRKDLKVARDSLTMVYNNTSLKPKEILQILHNSDLPIANDSSFIATAPIQVPKEKPFSFTTLKIPALILAIFASILGIINHYSSIKSRYSKKESEEKDM